MKWIFHIAVIVFITSCKDSDNAQSSNTAPISVGKVYQYTKKEVDSLHKQIQADNALITAKGIKATLWASDSLCPDPVAMAIDDDGVAYITRTVRQKHSEFDIRGYRKWEIPSIALASVDDRRAFLRKEFDKSRSKDNDWLADLNGDIIHDYRDLSVEKEEIYKIEDTDGDGLADKASQWLINMYDEVTDIAAGLLVRTKDAFLTMAPDVWRLSDKDKNGMYTTKKSISTGYGVHIGFSGHNLSGPIEGPDGRIYWNIGDIGAHIKDLDGKEYPNPHSGLIARSNPDGSDFEIVASGLRNTHEFVFDDYGNIISCDNDGDHPGESERLVHIVEGMDAGWRSHWQYGKYNDPKNNKYNVWMDEKLSVPHWAGQSAYILPPIQNFHNGPTGMIYNPGTALGSRWLNKFFVVEFVGTAANSHIWAFGLKPRGASFVLNGDEDFASGFLPTAIQFGPDGALYASDWVSGWGTKDYGRVWKFDDDDKSLESVRKETQRLIKLDYEKASIDDLIKHMAYADRRVRLKAQFELVNRKQAGWHALQRIAQDESKNQLQRIHAIWGMGQCLRAKIGDAAALASLLTAKDIEIATQAIKIIGDNKIKQLDKDIIPFVSSANQRVVFHAIQTLGRLESKSAMPAIAEAIIKNNDGDLYLRHAAIHALYKIGDRATVASWHNHANRSLRLAGVLAMRKWKDVSITKFLQDKDMAIVTEAARGINDDAGIKDAIPTLAKMLNQNLGTHEPLVRRVINAALRSGTFSDLNALWAYANKASVKETYRIEALHALTSWHDPSHVDRVDGRYLGPIKRDSTAVPTLIKQNIKTLLAEKNTSVLKSICNMIGGLKIMEAKPMLYEMYRSNKSAELSSSLILTLNTLKDDHIKEIITSSLASKDKGIRKTALSILTNDNVDAQSMLTLTDLVMTKGSNEEQQELLTTMQNIKIEHTKTALTKLIDMQNAGKLPPSVKLEFYNLMDKVKDKTITSKLVAQSSASPMQKYDKALYGGNAGQGYGIFNYDGKAQCVKCHMVNKTGSNVGPDLSKIGAQLTREQILESLIMPSAKIAKGYGMASVSLKDGTKAVGVLMDDNAHHVLLKTSQAEPLKIEKARISNIETYPSSMPDMGKKLKESEIRDLVEYLAGLK